MVPYLNAETDVNSLRGLHSMYPYPPPADDPRIHTDYDNVVGLTVYSSMVDDWMRDPNLRGVYRLLSGMLGKTLVLKLQAGGLKYNATSIEDVLGLAEEIGVVIRDIVAGGEPIYWSDMSCTMLSGMGTLMWAVSCIAGQRSVLTPGARRVPSRRPRACRAAVQGRDGCVRDAARASDRRPRAQLQQASVQPARRRVRPPLPGRAGEPERHRELLATTYAVGRRSQLTLADAPAEPAAVGRMVGDVEREPADAVQRHGAGPVAGLELDVPGDAELEQVCVPA